MMEGENSRMGHAEVMAMIRASAQKGFAGKAPLTPQDAVFRRASLESVRRIDPEATVVLDAAEALADAAIEMEVLAPDGMEALQAPLLEDPALRLAEARSEGYAAGRTDGLEEGRAAGYAAGRAEAEAAFAPAREAFVAAVAALSGGEDLSDRLSAVIADAVRRLAAERAGQMIDALPMAFAARVEAMADRVAQGVRAVQIRLHPDDLAAITPHLGGFDVLAGAALTGDARLARGDVDVRAEGIRMADLLEPAA